MTVKVLSEQEVLQEAIEVLLVHLGPAKVARVLSAWQGGGRDYLTLRKELFGEETVATLADTVENYQKRCRSPSANRR